MIHAAAEKYWLEGFRILRDKYLKALIVGLDKLRVSPKMLTFLGLVFIGLFFYFLPTHLSWAGWFLFLHMVMDGFDGPLARYQKKDSAKGAFLDLAADNIGGIVFILALIRVEALSGLLGAGFLVLTLLIFILGDWARQVGVKEMLIYKGRLFLMIAFLLYVLFGVNWLVELTGLFCAYMFVMELIWGYRIYRAL